MSRLLRFCLMLVAMLYAEVAYAAGKPAGYIVSWEPHDADIGKAAIIRRGGEVLAPALLMPLQDGDVVEVIDKAVTINIEAASGPAATSSSLAVSGELNADDAAIGLLGRLADAFAAPQAGSAPDSLSVPMAFDGQNFLIREGGPLYLHWTGGKPPYNLIFDIDGRRANLADLKDQQTVFDIPEKATNRFAVVIKDSGRKRVRVRFHIRGELPVVPEAIKNAPVSQQFKDFLVTAWIAQRLDGMWRIHTVRRLRNSGATSMLDRKLLELLEAGRSF